jgi:hypothetical protein
VFCGVYSVNLSEKLYIAGILCWFAVHLSTSGRGWWDEGEGKLTKLWRPASDFDVD